VDAADVREQVNQLLQKTELQRLLTYQSDDKALPEILSLPKTSQQNVTGRFPIVDGNFLG